MDRPTGITSRCHFLDSKMMSSKDSWQINVTGTDTNQQARWEKRYLEGKTAWDRGEPSAALALGLAEMPAPPPRVLIPACGAVTRLLNWPDGVMTSRAWTSMMEEVMNR